MKKRVFEVPSWATAMVSNFRSGAEIPLGISDVTIFNIVEMEELCLLDTEEEQYEALRGYLELED
jgi:hypothetical protein